MRRRFSRRGRRGGSGGRPPIDSSRVMARIVEEKVIEVAELVPFERADVPDVYAALGRGTRDAGEAGKPLRVSYAPLGGDALLGAIAAGLHEVGEGDAPFTGDVYAIAPTWTAAGLQRLARIGDLPFRVKAVSAPVLGESRGEIEPDFWSPPIPLALETVSAGLVNSEDRNLFERAASALEGLASKHGGSVRGTTTGIELVVMARRVAELKAESGVVLETLAPQRATLRLTSDDLAGALDRLEGQLRKRLNDRKVRDGEDGLRTRALPLLSSGLGLRAVTRWPVSGSDREVVDLIGIDSEGRPVAVAIREELDLDGVGELLDVGLALQPVLGLLLGSAEPPLRLGAPRLAVAAQRYSVAAAKALAALSLGHDLFEIRTSGRGLELASVSSADAIERAARQRRSRGRRGESTRGEANAEPDEEGTRGGRGRARGGRDRNDRGGSGGESLDALSAGDGEAASESNIGSGEEGESRGRSRRRRGRRRGGRGRDAEEGADRGTAAESDSSTESNLGEGERAQRDSRPLEISLFDLDEDIRDDDEGGSGARPRRRRGRRRGRRGASEDSAGGEGVQASDGSDSEPPARVDSAGSAEEDDDIVDIDDVSSLLDDDAPDLEEALPEPTYEEDESDADDSGDKSRIEREKRRLSRRSAKADAPVEPARAPRRRAAIVACDDRDSLLAAILLARDVRLLEGIWVYPQSELMTFFRSVTTDLRDDTPIHLVGFTPSPAGEVLRTAQLYADRLFWYDHHDWAPEDLGALKSVLSEDALQLSTGAGSSLPAVLSTCSRRSRFSDKLVDLGAGRFTQHDYERWGRLWWSRLAEIAKKPGDRRADVDPLLVGRPSDLSKEAARVAAPPLPEEVAWVSQRDFRIVHFAGYALVVLEVPAELNPHLAARIARERYGAAFSIAHRAGEELVVLGSDELSGKRSFDLGGLVDHLADKLEHVESLADEDHIARMSVRGLVDHPERLDEVVAELAMGRSILEG